MMSPSSTDVPSGPPQIPAYWHVSTLSPSATVAPQTQLAQGKKAPQKVRHKRSTSDYVEKRNEAPPASSTTAQHLPTSTATKVQN